MRAHICSIQASFSRLLLSVYTGGYSEERSIVQTSQVGEERHVITHEHLLLLQLMLPFPQAASSSSMRSPLHCLHSSLLFYLVYPYLYIEMVRRGSNESWVFVFAGTGNWKSKSFIEKICKKHISSLSIYTTYRNTV